MKDTKLTDIEQALIKEMRTQRVLIELINEDKEAGNDTSLSEARLKECKQRIEALEEAALDIYTGANLCL